VRGLQAELAALGLSSLGRSEAHVLATIDAIRQAVAGLLGLPAPRGEPVPVDFATGDRLLEEHATALLGEAASARRTRIMVTLPAGAGCDETLVHDLVVAGAELVRLRCSDGGPEAWASTIGRVREAEAALGRTVRVVMDLAGPRPLTGPIAPGPQVVSIHPTLDDLGRVAEPARVCLTAGGETDQAAVPVPVRDEGWLAERCVGELITFRDARRARRTLRVTATRPGVVDTTLEADSFLVPGTRLSAGRRSTTVTALPPRERWLVLRSGDDLRLLRDPGPTDPEARPARIGCTPVAVLDRVKIGDRVFFDDGCIGAVVEAISPEGARLWVTDAAPEGSRLRAGARVNLPDTDIGLPALTGEDVANLPFVVANADAVALSFVRDARDVERLQAALAELGGGDRGIILKIETPAAFGNLPEILLTAMRSPTVGVMIARGDLALEAGYVRLAEVQEEILWLCEAAHIPVIWATDVLDTLAQTGRPSRAEVTDAAASGRAECVMLNYGPHAPQAVDFLDDLLTRMAAHQRKKNSLLRRLHAWDPPAASRADPAPAVARRRHLIAPEDVVGTAPIPVATRGGARAQVPTATAPPKPA
jgi:pyruvate kinase